MNRAMRWWVTLALLTGIALIFGGCGVLPSGRGWGQDATWQPGWKRIEQAALKAATASSTWAPAVGALAFSVGDWDREVSDWAVENTPLFGDPLRADRRSDDLLHLGFGLALATALATPSGEHPGPWLAAKAKGGLVEAAGMTTTLGATLLFKELGARERPDGEDHRSFPSGHTSLAFAGATLASRHAERLSLSPGVSGLFRAGVTTVAAGTGWARIEAGKHFPSDVLAGAALGHFLSAFFHDAFLGLDPHSQASLSLASTPGGMTVGFSRRF